VLFSCPEACFHYAKLRTVAERASPERALELIGHAKKLTEPGLEPVTAKGLGGKGKAGLRLSEEELVVWIDASLNIQRAICSERFAHSGGTELASILVATGSAQLLHYERMANENSFWGGKVVDGKIVGQNHLGRIWMEFRGRLQVSDPSIR
jgi:predicted NAD-dependent protein-ADP-ribosyltransferase YbiA (DUF1768 family)